MTQNFSGLMEADEGNDRSTKLKYWYDDALSTSEKKWREMEAMLVQMHSEHEIERQNWDAKRSMVCMQWENDNHLWDETCVRLKAKHSREHERNSS